MKLNSISFLLIFPAIAIMYFIAEIFPKSTVFYHRNKSLSQPAGTMTERAAPLEDWRANFRQDIEGIKAKKDLIQAITLENSHADAISRDSKTI